MIQRFVRDESGITLAVAVFMVVLIGVMGAGLLTFVMSDSGSVLEVNRGQKAMDIAEAGVQAAKAHLREDSYREHYDTDANGANDCVPPSGIRVGKENWGKATYHWEPDPNAATSNPGECFTLTSNPADNASTPWPENYGVTRTFGGGRFHVTIECFNQFNDATGSADPCVGGVKDSAGVEEMAPDPTANANETKFFKVTSTGYSSADGSGGVRKIVAVYTTSKRTYAPIAYWTPRDIQFSGTKCVSKMSFFAGRNITGVDAGQGCGPDDPFTTQKFIAHRPPTTTLLNGLGPQDAIYGHWKNGYNPTMRSGPTGTGTNPDGTPLFGPDGLRAIVKPGFGALGLVCASTNGCPTGPSNATNDANSVADGRNDYDRTTGTDSLRPNNTNLRKQYKFVSSITNAANQITFPFDTNGVLANPSSPDPSRIVDAGLLEEMRSTANLQGSCYSVGASCSKSTTSPLTIDTGGGGGKVAWPGPGTTFFVDGADVTFAQGGSTKPDGIIVVRNGNFSFSSSSVGFKGLIIVVGNGNLKGDGSCDSVNSSTNKGYYKQAGSGQLDGYVAASGCMEINGNVSPSTTIDYTNLNTFYDLKLWSWRELYQ